MSLMKSQFARYFSAVIGIAAVFLLRLGIIRLAGGDLPYFITFYPIVMVVALFAGLGPGLLSTGASALISFLWIIPPPGDPASHGFSDHVGLVLFMGMGVLMSVVGWNYGRARDNLKAEKRRLYDVLETLPAYVVLLKPDHKILFANRFFRERFGECEGKVCYEFLYGRNLPCENCEPFKVLNNGEKHHWEWTGPDGKNYDVHGFPFRDADDTPLIMEMGIDITDQKKAEEALRDTLDTLEVRVVKRTAELARAKEEWELTFNSVPDLIAILDKNQRIVRVNRAMAERMGVTPDQPVGRFCYECVHGTDHPPHYCPYAQTIADGREHTVEAHEDKLGGFFSISTNALRNEAGEIIGSVHIARDVTKHKHAENERLKSEMRLKRAQEIAHLGSWELDVIGNRLSWSDEVYRIFGLKPQEFGATYEAFLERVHPDDRKAVDDAYSSSLREGRDSYEIEHRIVRRDNGEIRVVHEKCDHVRDDYGRIVRSVGMVHDVTERKRAEAQLKEFYRELEQKVEQKTAELLSVKRLSDIGTLAATVAHELRNPLGVIQLAVENMRRKKLVSGTDEHLVRIEKKLVESNQIIDNLLFYSKIKPPKFEHINLHGVIDECLDTMQTAHKEKNVQLERKFDEVKNVEIEADPLQVKEILSNILNNAYESLKDEGGRIELHALKGDNGLVEIEIKDNGGGIRREDLERVSQPFFSTKSKGTGLGLAICDELINMHGGKMKISSQEGVGTKVNISLPINRNFMGM